MDKQQRHKLTADTLRAARAYFAVYPNLSAHDCWHFWDTDAARNGTDPFRLQETGGWSSLTMPRR